MDKLLSGLIYVPRSITPNTLRAGIEAVLQLRNAIGTSSELSTALTPLVNLALDENDEENDSNSLLRLISENCSTPTLGNISNAISLMLSDTFAFSNSTNAWSKHQECFAIKEGTDGLLDLARATFMQLTQEIYAVSVFIDNILGRDHMLLIVGRGFK